MVKIFMDNLTGLRNHPGACVEGIPGRVSGGGETQMCVDYHAIDWRPRLNKKEKRGPGCTSLHACCAAWGPGFMSSTDAKRLLSNPSSGGRGRQIPGCTGQSSWVGKLQVIGKGQSTGQVEHPVEERARACFTQSADVYWATKLTAQQKPQLITEPGRRVHYMR